MCLPLMTNANVAAMSIWTGKKKNVEVSPCKFFFFFSSVNTFLHNYVFLELISAFHLLATHIIYMIISDAS